MYALDAPLVGRLPADLILTVPGGAFPRFASVAFPGAALFELDEPTAQERGAVSIDTVFAWEPLPAADAVVVLTIGDRDLDRVVRCFAADDGSFAFLAETRTLLGAAFSGRLDAMARIVYSLVTDASRDAVLVLGAATTREFVYLPEPVF